MSFTLLLIGLTLLVLLLPLLPALQEWRRPSDVTPLPIDEADALEPDYMARRFAGRLDEALAREDDALSGVALVRLTRRDALGDWPLDAKEVRSGRSRRIWHSEGDCRLPEGLHGLAEISSGGSLLARAGHSYRALRARDDLLLPERVRVLRWAHGHQVVVGQRSVLVGRVSASHALLVGREVSFSLLHAPVIRFAGRVDTDRRPDPGGLRAGAPAGDLQRLEGALTIEALRHWDGDLDVDGPVTIGEGCRGRGRLRATGTVQVGAGAVLAGSLAATGEIYLAAGAEVQGPVISESAIVLGPGTVIGAPGAQATVRAPRIELGRGVVVHGTVWAGAHRLALDTAPPGPVVIGYDAPVRWDAIARRGQVTHDLTLPARAHHDGDLVCQGDLEIGERSHLVGSLKAHGDLIVAAGTRIEGTLVAPGRIVLGAGCRITGPVMSETAVEIGPGCVIGSPARPATVCAPAIEVAVGVVVHGTVWAGHSGDAPALLQIESAVDLEAELDERVPQSALPGQARA